MADNPTDAVHLHLVQTICVCACVFVGHQVGYCLVVQEPITFAPAGKPQFMKLLFQALADATKAAAAAAAEQQQHGRRAGRSRRSSKHQQKQQDLADAGAGKAKG